MNDSPLTPRQKTKKRNLFDYVDKYEEELNGILHNYVDKDEDESSRNKNQKCQIISP